MVNIFPRKWMMSAAVASFVCFGVIVGFRWFYDSSTNIGAIPRSGYNRTQVTYRRPVQPSGPRIQIETPKLTIDNKKTGMADLVFAGPMAPNSVLVLTGDLSFAKRAPEIMLSVDFMTIAGNEESRSSCSHSHARYAPRSVARFSIDTEVPETRGQYRVEIAAMSPKWDPPVRTLASGVVTVE